MSRPYLDINSFKSHVRRRAAHILDAFHVAQSKNSRHHSLLLGASVLELDNLLIQSLRAYAFCRIWEAQRAGQVPKIKGRYMTSSEFSANFVRVLAPAKYTNIGRPAVATRDLEWAIRDPKDTAKLLRGVIGSVHPNLSNAIALNGNIFFEMKPVRHFYAHRCEDTTLKLKNIVPQFSSGFLTHPDDYVLKVLPGATEEKFLSWWNDYDAFFSVA